MENNHNKNIKKHVCIFSWKNGTYSRLIHVFAVDKNRSVYPNISSSVMLSYILFCVNHKIQFLYIFYISKSFFIQLNSVYCIKRNITHSDIVSEGSCCGGRQETGSREPLSRSCSCTFSLCDAKKTNLIPFLAQALFCLWIKATRRQHGLCLLTY